MARRDKRRGNTRRQDAEPGGLWHQPALMNLVSDLLIVAAVAALGWAGLGALQRLPAFPLRELVVAGPLHRAAADQIEHAARNAVVGNFFTVNLDEARAAFEKLPWVRKATLQRRWPDGLILTIEEHEPVARWQRLGNPSNPDDGGRLVNRQGEIFVADLPAEGLGLPTFSGPEGSANELLERRTAFDAALAGIGRRVTAVTLSPRQAWHVRLDDGIALELGRDQAPHPLAERLERFVSSYPRIRTHLGAVRVADMRYPNGFAVRGGAPGTATPATRQDRRA